MNEETIKGNKSLAEQAKEIADGNAILDVFMGYKIHNHSSYKTIEKDGNHSFEGVHSYHKKWENLMPAWFKFRDLKLTGAKMEIGHSGYSELISREILRPASGTPIEAFNLLVEAVTWFNSLKGK